VKQLILGGARSGKSRLAQTRAESIAQQRQDRGLPAQLIYLATCDRTTGDQEMNARIARHVQDRGEQWRLVEYHNSLADTLLSIATDDTVILVDCLTLWLTRCLLVNEDLETSLVHWQEQKQALESIVNQLPGNIIFISNEVGQGIVPLGRLSRVFVDEAGFLHQSLASHCDHVCMTIAGLPMVLK